MTSIAIIEAVNTTAVQFHGQPIITAMVAGVAYVAMKPIVENLGLSWTSQHRKLMNSGGKYGYAHMSIPSKGGIQEMLCLPLRKLNGWLFSINPEKVRADIRDRLIQYQEEYFAVLHEYWTKGEVTKKAKTRQSTATQLTPLRQTAERLIATGLGKIYPDIWKLVHSRFDIEHIHQLQPHQVGEAIEYLNAIEGEFLGKQESLPSPKISYPMSWFDDYRWIIGKNALSTPWNYPANLLIPNGDYPNPCGRLLSDLKNAGHEVDAALFQLLSLQHHLEMLNSKVRAVGRAIGN
ncbi:phage antirepressor N-terminal domain-containing protein [Yersinia enterocolitica]|uniref:phage antirepressor N-terminal domain-containing protein n=1 Tax=Yersinia enterocolitica TaxID=630 RepID=UPI0005E41998|nr:phage antirepressor N-terminal domain-containing protein [Yersinia enterocolitica]CFB70218.1 Phage anti-repressor protein [Yersinia enterocolitica]